MTVYRVRLNDNDAELLEKIYEYGGYTTSLSVGNYRNDCTKRGIRYIMKKLKDNGYLEAVPFYSKSDKDVIYKLTPKTCRMFGSKDPYGAKKHSEAHVMRMLAQQHFLFEVYNSVGENIITENEYKISLLTKSANFECSMLPKKSLNGVPVNLVEECIIDGRNVGDKVIRCIQNGESLYDFNSFKGLIIVYTDKYAFKAGIQLKALIERYKSMIEAEKVSISFIIVTDNIEREEYYRTAIRSLKEKQENYGIPNNFIRFHMHILENKLKVSNAEIQDLSQKIQEAYSNIPDITEDDYIGIPVEDIRLIGTKAISRAVYGILESDISYEQKKIKVRDFFRKLYKLCSAEVFVKGMNYDMKVYLIRRRYSLASSK
jgi:hypothetical protein